MIAKKPTKKKSSKKFINGAAGSENSTSKLQPVMMKVPREVLAQIDEKAASLGLSRTAFMIQAAILKGQELKSEAARNEFVVAAYKARAAG